MIRAVLAALALSAGAATAGAPAFEALPDALPSPHVYAGGWEFFVGGGVAAFDCNDDGFPDLAVAGGANPARLFVNATEAPGGRIRFAEGEWPEMTGVTGLWPLDIDSDGRLDLAVMRAGANRLLRGRGGCRFEDATADWGFSAGDAWSTAFSATWEPGAAFPTLAVGNYVDRDDPDGPFRACDANTLHRPRGRGSDAPVRPGRGPDAPVRPGRGYGAPVRLAPGYCALSMLFSDWARQGRTDLRVSNDRHYYVRGGHEQMWRLDPLRRLGPGDGFDGPSIWGMGVASADITGDGVPEVMLTSMGDQLLRIATDAPGYRAADYARGATATRPFTGGDGRPSTGWHAEFADIDNDAALDLFIAKGNVDQMPGSAMRDPNNLLMQRPDGRFAERAGAAGVASMARSRGAALPDLDRDGRRDLVVVNRRAPMEIWRNRTRAGNWLAVRARQGPPNRRAVGGWVELRLPGGRVQSREITVGGGHGGDTAGPVHFGLGPAKRAELRVVWPDGTAAPWREVAAGRFLTLRREAPRRAAAE